MAPSSFAAVARSVDMGRWGCSVHGASFEAGTGSAAAPADEAARSDDAAADDTAESTSLGTDTGHGTGTEPAPAR